MDQTSLDVIKLVVKRAHCLTAHAPRKHLSGSFEKVSGAAPSSAVLAQPSVGLGTLDRALQPSLLEFSLAEGAKHHKPLGIMGGRHVVA